MGVLQELVDTHSDNKSNLMKIDDQFLSCLFVTKDPMENLSDKYKDFQVTMEKLQANDIQAIILMDSFFSKVRNISLTTENLSKDAFDNDERFSYLFPKADMITLGRLNHLYNTDRYYSLDKAGAIQQAINLLKNNLTFGYTSGVPLTFEGDIDAKTVDDYINNQSKESVAIFAYYLKQHNHLSYYINKTKSLLMAFQSTAVSDFISHSEKNDLYQSKRKDLVSLLEQMKKKLSISEK